MAIMFDGNWGGNGNNKYRGVGTGGRSAFEKAFAQKYAGKEEDRALNQQKLDFEENKFDQTIDFEKNKFDQTLDFKDRELSAGINGNTTLTAPLSLGSATPNPTPGINNPTNYNPMDPCNALGNKAPAASTNATNYSQAKATSTPGNYTDTILTEK